MKFFSGKRFWLWALPFVAVGLGLWRVREARTWSPKSVGLFASSFNPGDEFRVPIAWRSNGVWILRDDGAASLGVAPQIDALKNWNRARVPVHIVTQNANEVAAVSPADDVLRTRSHSLELWRNGRRIRVAREEDVVSVPDVSNDGAPPVLAIAPDGTRWASASQSDRYGSLKEGVQGISGEGAVLWKAHTGRQIVRYKARGGSFTALAFSPDSRRLAGVTVNGTAFLWNARTGREVRHWRAHPFVAATLAWSPDGKTLLTGANPRLTENATQLFMMLRSDGGASSINGSVGWGKDVMKTNAQGDFSFNGITDRSLRLWDVQTGKLTHQWESQTGICSAQFSPDGGAIAVGTHGEALIFDAATLKVTRRLPMKDFRQWPLSVAWSPDGATLAVACAPRLTLWRVR